jgi:hypothetical protein
MVHTVFAVPFTSKQNKCQHLKNKLFSDMYTNGLILFYQKICGPLTVIPEMNEI